uniref:Methylated-DNA--protein-cysteine methyltransferase n=1 Tax=Hyaloperonospora arabidopsidis (strain Emoy2) TaxID=559515 RepID=M4B4S7_HYAAE
MSPQKNPFAPEVPCHRVVTTSLDIGGFQGTTGEDSPFVQKKRTLLAKEGVLFTRVHKVAGLHYDAQLLQ